VVRVKKYFLLILFTILFFIGKDNVWAVGAYLEQGDFTVSCVYHNGMAITVSKTDIYFSQASTSTGVDYSENMQLFLLSNQRNKRSSLNGKITQYNSGNFLVDGKCPRRLYAFSVEDNSLDDVVQEGLMAPLIEDADNYLYSTSFALSTDETGEDTDFLSGKDITTKESSRDTYLVSESVELTTSKKTKMCDYKAYVEGDEEGGASTMTLYLFDNITFAVLGDYTTALESKVKECPNSLESEKDNPLYINDPKPTTLISNNSSVAVTQYKENIRYYISTKSSNCKNNNDNMECSVFKFLGERDPGKTNQEDKLCEKLGNELVEIIQEIVSIMQIVVPGLVIILTGVDIGKLVANGQIDEELPKRKKTIIIRFVVMMIFFFLPWLTDLIIGLLKDAGLIGVEYVKCIFE